MALPTKTFSFSDSLTKSLSDDGNPSTGGIIVVDNAQHACKVVGVAVGVDDCHHGSLASGGRWLIAVAAEICQVSGSTITSRCYPVLRSVHAILKERT